MDDFQNSLHIGKAWLDRRRNAGRPGHAPTAPFGAPSPEAHVNPLQEVQDFGENPGQLRMLMRVPSRSIGVSSSAHAHGGSGHRPGSPSPAPPLVIALHGCLQSPQSYDLGSGWSHMAERCGFALLMPGQRPANNPNRCFNWFSPEDTARDAGEAHSIRQMIAYMVANHDADPARIYVVGLSAGGAMAACLLSIYPEVFSAGAVLSGLPFGSATTVQEALACMAQGRRQSPSHWAAHVRAASSHAGPWPRLSVWHGSADTIVHPSNAEALVNQWTALHGLTQPPRETMIAGHRRRVWRGSDGRDVLEMYDIARMGHGVALGNGGDGGGDPCGAVGSYHLEVGLCSTRQIAGFWGLSTTPPVIDADAWTRTPHHEILPPMAGIGHPVEPRRPVARGVSDDVREHITAALKQAGLLEKSGTANPADPRGIVASTLRSLGLLKP